GRSAFPEWIRLEPVRPLTGGRLERRERAVADGVPDQQRAGRAQVNQVAVHRRSGGGARLDADVAGGAWAVDAIVDRDVVGNSRSRRAALDVDARRDVLVHAVGDHPLPRRLVVVDPVVAVGPAYVAFDLIARARWLAIPA